MICYVTPSAPTGVGRVPSRQAGDGAIERPAKGDCTGNAFHRTVSHNIRCTQRHVMLSQVTSVLTQHRLEDVVRYDPVASKHGVPITQAGYCRKCGNFQSLTQKTCSK